jgi:hypothetical protein
MKIGGGARRILGGKSKASKRRKAKFVMGEFKRKKLHSGSKTGPVVKNRAQAVAIMLSQTGQSNKK